MALLVDVKQALRLSTDALDTEVEDLISAAKDDLALAGIITATDDTDSLIKRAIIYYCKANFGYENDEAERLYNSYEMIKTRLAMSTAHASYTVTFSASEQCKIEFDGVSKQTNNAGEVVFYSKAKNHVPYSVNNASYEYVDVSEDITVEVVV